MPGISGIYYARGDGLNAGNAAINADPQSQVPVATLQFESGTLGAGNIGDLTLDHVYDGGGNVIPGVDPNTTVWVNGVEEEFTLEFTGTLPIKKSLEDLAGFDVRGQTVTVITIASTGQRYFFLNDDIYNVDSSIMLVFPNGAHDIASVDDTAPPPPVCFAKGSLIHCESGEVAVENLTAGDMVITVDGSLAKIQWIGERHLSADDIARNPSFAPVRIAKDALGANKPNAELSVSQQHRMLLDDWRLELMVGGNEALVAAKHLVNDSSIRIDRTADGVVYYHVMFDTHQIIVANGTASESFHPGQWALDSLENDARDELLALFPQLADSATAYGPTARPALKSYEAKALSNFA